MNTAVGAVSYCESGACIVSSLFLLEQQRLFVQSSHAETYLTRYGTYSTSFLETRSTESLYVLVAVAKKSNLKKWKKSRFRATD